MMKAAGAGLLFQRRGEGAVLKALKVGMLKRPQDCALRQGAQSGFMQAVLLCLLFGIRTPALI